MIEIVSVAEASRVLVGRHYLGPTTVVGGTVTFEWRSGIVYVMNENGSTISKYDLGPHGRQLGGDDLRGTATDE